MVPFTLIIVLIMATLTISAFSYFLSEGIEKARTVAFALMAFTQLFNALNLRSINDSLFKIGFKTNKYLLWALAISVILIVVALYTPLQQFFTFRSLNIFELFLIIALSSTVLLAGEIYKR